ncbi:MAG: hypothetical protein AB1407_09515 [Spirochaetota bacterium]
MNDNGNGKPKEGGKKPLGRPGRHGGQRFHGNPQGKPQRDSSLLGIRKEEPKKVAPAVDCAICSQPIFDLTGALADKDTGQPVHFDCALERVAKAEDLAPKEKIVYLGAGCFAVVEHKNGNDGAFVVKRRIRWEKEGEKQAWRKDISSYITKI